MGASESRSHPSSQPLAVTPQLLNDSLDGDIQYLNININDISYSIDYLVKLYIYAIQQSHIDNNNIWLSNKQYKLHHKLLSSNIINTTQYNIHYINRCHKYIQRIISEYSATHDSNSDILAAKIELLVRSHRSYTNMCARQEINNGKRSENTAVDKKQYVRAVLLNNDKQWIDKQLNKNNKSIADTNDTNTSTDNQTSINTSTADSTNTTHTTTVDYSSIFTVDTATIDKLVEHADTLPDILGATGLLGVMSANERSAYSDAMKRRAELQRSSSRGLADAQTLLNRLGMQVQRVVDHSVQHNDDIDDDDVDDDYDEDDTNELHHNQSINTISLNNQSDLQEFLAAAHGAGLDAVAVDNNTSDDTAMNNDTTSVQRQNSNESDSTTDVLRSLREALRDVDGVHLGGNGSVGIRNLMLSLTNMSGVDISVDSSGATQSNDSSTELDVHNSNDNESISSTRQPASETGTHTSTQVQRSESVPTDDSSHHRNTSISAYDEQGSHFDNDDDDDNDNDDGDDEDDEQLQLAMQMSMAIQPSNNDDNSANNDGMPFGTDTTTTTTTSGTNTTQPSATSTSQPHQSPSTNSNINISGQAVESDSPANTDSGINDYTSDTIPSHLLSRGMTQEDYDMTRAIRLSLLSGTPQSSSNTPHSNTTSSIEIHNNPFDILNSTANTPRHSVVSSDTSSHINMLNYLSRLCDNIAQSIVTARQTLNIDQSSTADANQSTTSNNTSAAATTSTLRDLLDIASGFIDVQRATITNLLHQSTHIPLDHSRNYFVQSTTTLQTMQDALQQLTATNRSLSDRTATFNEFIQRQRDTNVPVVSPDTTTNTATSPNTTESSAVPTSTPTTAATTSTPVVTSSESTSATTTGTAAAPTTTASPPAVTTSTTSDTATQPPTIQRQPAVVPPQQYPVNTYDREFKSKPLLTMLLAESIRINDMYYDTILQSNNIDNVSIKINPIFKLLYYVQRDLFRKHAMHRKETESLSPILNQYCIKLLIACTKSIDSINKLSSSINIERCKLVLHSTLIGQVLPSALLYMYATIYHPQSRAMAAQITNLLMKFNDSYGECIHSIDHTLLSDRNTQFAGSECTWIKTLIAESAHCYQPLTQDDQQIEIPNATHIIVHFDTRCATTRNRDYLELYSADGTPIRELHGDGQHWPKRPICVNGDRVTFRFRSDAVVNNEATKYGYKAYVTGIRLPMSNDDTHSNDESKSSNDSIDKVFQPPVPLPQYTTNNIIHSSNLVDLYDLSIKLSVRCCRINCSIPHKENELDKKYNKWLLSQLFMNGIESYQCDTRAVIMDSQPELIITEQPRAIQILTSEAAANTIDININDTMRRVSKDKSAQPELGEPQIEYTKPEHYTIGNDDDAEFILSYIELQPNTPGDLFDKKMKQLVKSNALLNKGGAVVHRTVRSVVSALLKHTNLIKSARLLADNMLHDDTQQAALIAIIRKGQSLHRWIISTRQSVQQSLAASDLPLTESMQQLQSSLDVICAPVYNRALFINTFQSAALQDDDDINTLTRSYSNARQRTVTYAHDKQSSSLLKLWSQSKRNSMKASEYSAMNDIIGGSVAEQILNFVQDIHTPLKQFQQLIQLHTTRVKQRIESINCIIKLINNKYIPSSTLSSLYIQWTPFRQYNAYPRLLIDADQPAGTHHMCGVELASPTDRKHLHTTFNDMFTLFCNKLSNATSTSEQAVLLNSVAVQLDPVDHTTIEQTNLLGVLNNIITRSTDTSLIKLALYVKQMIELNVLIDPVNATLIQSNDVDDDSDKDNDDDNDTITPTRSLSQINRSTSQYQSKLTNTQQSLLNGSIETLHHQLIQLPNIRQQLVELKLSDAQLESSKSAEPLCRQYCINMTHCIEQLSALYITCKSNIDIVQHLLQPNTWIKLSQVLSSILVGDIPRLQYIAHQFTMLLLQNHADSSVLNNQIKHTATCNDLIQLLYQSIGMILSSQLSDAGVFNIIPYNYLNGEIVYSNASAALTMLHKLSANKLYASALQRHIQSSLQQLPHAQSNQQQYGNVLTALALLGGYNDQLRVGCTVISTTTANSTTINSSKDYGTVIHIDRLSNKVLVIFQHTPNKLVECDCSEVKPITTTLHHSAYMKLDSTTMKSFESFVCDLISSNEQYWSTYESNKLRLEQQSKLQADTAAAEKERLLAEHAAEQAEQANQHWNCSVCTFTNPITDRQCNMCTTPAPAPPVRTNKRVSNNAKTDNINTTIDNSTNEQAIQLASVDVTTLLYHQLRCTALKALSSILLRHSGNDVINRSAILPLLLRLSTLPTEVDDFHTIEQLDASDQRLNELLHNYKHGINDEISELKKSKQSYELLYTPLRHLTVHVPTTLDVSTSRGVTFSTDNINIIKFDVSTCGEALAGAAHSNHLVPAVPLYYFEVTILQMGEPRQHKHAFNIAVGLHRSGFELSSRPGTHSGYAYTALGDVFYTDASTVNTMKYGDTFKQGDVVGVLWNIKHNSIAFTLNGKRMQYRGDTSKSKSLSNVNGRFYPAVWLESDQSSVHVNFGQQPFIFDYASELPSGYEHELIAEQQMNKNRPQRTAAELKRRTMAEELVIMMGGTFPLEVCEIAIERSNDDVTYAANWLIESGHQELERMSAEAIRASQLEDEERKLAEIGITSDDNDTNDNDDDLVEWLTGGTVQSHTNTLAAQRSAQGWIIGRAAQPQRRTVSNAAELLDDDMENSVPLGVERQEITTQQNVEQPNRITTVDTRSNDTSADTISSDPLKLDEITPGQLLLVTSNINTIHNGSTDVIAADMNIDAYSNRVGIVSGINVNNRTIQLLFVNCDHAMKHQLWFPITRLQKASKLWSDICADVRGTDWNTLANKYIINEQMLSLRRLRSSILQIFQSWPSDIPFTLEQLGGSTAVMNILKLASSEYLYTVVASRNRVSSTAATHPVIDALRDQLTNIVRSECIEFDKSNNELPSLRINESHYNNKHNQQDLTKLLSADHREPLLCVLLVEECILHFVQAVKYPPPVIVKQSSHPYKSHDDVRDKLHIPGATKLMITFDSQCALNSDMLTRLAFYRDDQYQDIIISCGNRPRMNRFETCVIPGDTIYYKFTSGSNADQWGYKFKVSPVELRISDYRALRSLNMEMTAYLLQLIIQNLSSKLFLFYMVHIYNAIVYYVINAKPSSKSRGVELLTKFLLHAHHVIQTNEKTTKYAHDQFDLTQLQPLSAQMDQLLDTQEQSMQSSAALQSLIELIATSNLHVNINATATTELIRQPGIDKTTSSIDSTQYIDVKSIGTTSIRIVKAVYGILDQHELQRDITNELQSYLESTGCTQLYIPASNQLLYRIDAFAVDPAPKRSDKKLSLTYEVVKHTMDIDTQQMCDTILRRVDKICNLSTSAARSNGVLIRSEMSVLDKIVQLSSWSMELSSSLSHGYTSMPHELSLLAARHEAIARSYYPILPITGQQFSNDTRIGVHDAGYAGNNFTLSFWIYMNDSNTSPGNDTDNSESSFSTGNILGTPSTPAPAKKSSTSSAKPLSKSNPIRHIISKGNNNTEVNNSYNSHNRALMYYHSGWSLHLGHNDDKLVFTVYVPYQPSFICTSNTELERNKWSHVSVLVSRGQVKFVINGTEDAHKRIAPFRRFTRDPFLLGKLPVGYYEASDSDNVRSKSAIELDEQHISVNACVVDMRFYTHTLSVQHINKHVKSIHKNSNFNIDSIDSRWDVQDRMKISSIPLQHIVDIRHSKINYTPAMDRQLITMFTAWVESDHHKRHATHQHQHDRQIPELPSMNDIQIHSPLLSIDSKLLVSYPLISHLSINALKSRFVCIQVLNLRIASVLPCIDFGQASAEWSLSHRLSEISALILREVKNIVWHRILQQTCTQQSTNVVVNRSRAQRAKEKGELDGLKSVFGQLYKQLHFIKPSVLRCQYAERPFRLTYEGEGGTDAGGLFRDSLSHVCAELQSINLPLFIPTPNSRNNTQDMYICNPQATTPLHISMYSFVGKLMGIAIRGGHVLNLDLPSFVWKPLVQQSVTINDVAEIDSSAIQPLTDIQAALTQSDQPFNDLVSNITFTGIALDGNVVELKDNGVDINVTIDNYKEFIELYTSYKLNEVSQQIDAIKRGIRTIVPISLLPLFTCDELEQMICGNREIDIEYLRSNTRYRSPVHSTDQHIQWLWRALNEFTADERQKFLRFTWGQSRLPTTQNEWTQKMEVTPASIDNNNALPVSHTCFDTTTEVLIHVNNRINGWMNADTLMRYWSNPQYRNNIWIASLRQSNTFRNTPGDNDQLVYSRLVGVVEPFVYGTKYDLNQHPVRIQCKTGIGGGIDLLVTPDHNMYASALSYSRPSTIHADTWHPYTTVQAQCMVNSPEPNTIQHNHFNGWRIKTSAPITNTDYEFTLPALCDLLNVAQQRNIHIDIPLCHRSNAEHPVYAAHTFTGSDMDVWISFVGFHCTAGSIHTGGSSESYVLHYTQKAHPEFISNTWDLLQAVKRCDGSKLIPLGWYRRWVTQLNRWEYCCTDVQIITYLLGIQLHTSNQQDNITLPHWVWLLSSRQARLFLSGMAHGNGSHSAKSEHCTACDMTHLKFGSITTTSKRNADEIHRLAMHAGYNSRMVFYDQSNRINHKSGRVHTGYYDITIHRDDDDDVYVQLHAKNTNYIVYDTNPKIRDQLFWCVTTAAQSHVILVRRRVSNYTDKLSKQDSEPTLCKYGNPVGDTWLTAYVGNCFFSLELPRYTQYEILREKIRYAINHAISIDTDYNARAEEIE